MHLLKFRQSIESNSGFFLGALFCSRIMVAHPAAFVVGEQMINVSGCFCNIVLCTMNSVVFWTYGVSQSETFLANVKSRSRLLYAVTHPPVICLSVTLVHPTQAVEIFRNISTSFCTLSIRWHQQKILWRSSQGNSSIGGVKHKGVAKYKDFGPIEGCVSETVQDRR